jgi:hypothetical protein
MCDSYAVFYFTSSVDEVTIEFIESAGHTAKMPVLKYTGINPASNRHRRIYYPRDYYSNAVHFIRPNCLDVPEGSPHNWLDETLRGTFNLFNIDTQDPTPRFCIVGYTFEAVFNLCPTALPADVLDAILEDGALREDCFEFDRQFLFSHSILQYVDLNSFFIGFVQLGLTLRQYTLEATIDPTEPSVTLFYRRNDRTLLPQDNGVEPTGRFSVDLYYRCFGDQDRLVILQSVKSDDRHSGTATETSLDESDDDLDVAGT